MLALRHATVNGGGVEANAAGQLREGLVDLLGQLAGRCDYQRARFIGNARLVATGSQLGNQWNTEGNGLARAGLTAAQHVMAGKCCRNRCCLNGERRGRTHLGKLLSQTLR